MATGCNRHPERVRQSEIGHKIKRFPLHATSSGPQRCSLCRWAASRHDVVGVVGLSTSARYLGPHRSERRNTSCHSSPSLASGATTSALKTKQNHRTTATASWTLCTAAPGRCMFPTRCCAKAANGAREGFSATCRACHHLCAGLPCTPGCYSPPLALRQVALAVHYQLAWTPGPVHLSLSAAAQVSESPKSPVSVVGPPGGAARLAALYQRRTRLLLFSSFKVEESESRK